MLLWVDKISRSVSEKLPWGARCQVCNSKKNLNSYTNIVSKTSVYCNEDIPSSGFLLLRLFNLI